MNVLTDRDSDECECDTCKVNELNDLLSFVFDTMRANAIQLARQWAHIMDYGDD